MRRLLLAGMAIVWAGLLLPATGLAQLSWSGPTSRDTTGQGPPLDAVACVAADRCVAIDSAGAEVSFDPSDPGPDLPVPVDASAPTALTCTGISQCVAVDIAGNEVTFDPAHPGGAVTSTIDSGNVLTAVACVTGQPICVAVDTAGAEITFDPATPDAAQPKTIDSGGVLVGVSCVDASTCMAIDAGQKQVTFDPVKQTVSSTGSADPGGGSASLTALTCVSASQCLAFDSQGRKIILNPQNPGTITATVVDISRNSIIAATCASSSQCMAIDSGGNEVSFAPAQSNGTLTAFNPPKQLTGVACATASRCAAVDGAGQAFAFDPAAPAGTSPRLVDAMPSYTAVTCLTATECTAADDFGDAVTFDPHGGPPVASGAVDASAVPIYSISCPSSDQCTAVDQAGQATTFSPARPGPPAPTVIVKNQSLLGVSCPLTTQCTAVDDNGYAATFNPQSPTSARYLAFRVPPGTAIAGIACISNIRCLALDAVGDVLSFDPLSPGRPVPVKVLSGPGVAIACPGSRLCVAVDGDGTRATFDPLDPAKATTSSVDSDQPIGLTCPSATFCVLADTSGRAVEFDPGGAGATSTHAIGSAGQINALACGSVVSCTAVDSGGTAFLGAGVLPSVPHNSSPPRLAGRPVAGATLRVVVGAWSPAPTAVHVQWERCGALGRNCAPVPGATAQTLLLGAGDVGHAIRVSETADDPAGTGVPAVSSASAPVAGAPAPPGIRAVVGGLRQGRPRLVLSVTAARYGPRLQTLAITLPPGLSIRLRRRGTVVLLDSGRRLKGFVAHATGRVLTLKLKHSVAALQVQIGRPGLSEGAGLHAAVRHRRVRGLSIVVRLPRSGGESHSLLARTTARIAS